ncbi:MAG TPA: hypothetical protein VKS01_11045 [Bryobacteraceae bacterium]|nr:hypothetical protein [Bryobacteraceae bacterium]
MLALLAFAGGISAQSLFDFHSNFWLNLHLRLYDDANSKRDAPDVYQHEIAKHDLLEDYSARIDNLLSRTQDEHSLKDSGLDAELIAALEAAAPAYRTKWAEVDRANRAWIAKVEPLIAKYGDALKQELSTAYGMDWPSTPIRVDVVEHANRSGAFTTIEPPHITISSIDSGNQGNAALEILFHEASHVIAGKMMRALSAEAKAGHKLFPRRDFWHAILFYTTGEIVRRHLEGYTPYAIDHGLYDRAWMGVREILDANWKPYLDGQIDMNTAIHRVVEAYGVAQ